MKRLQALFPALLLILSLAACGGGQSSPTDSQDQGSNAGIPSPKAGSELVFTYKDCPLPMNAEFGPLLDYLGEPDSYFEAASCAFDGLDKTYTYGGVEIITYPDESKEDVDYISSVRLLDNSVSTPEGVTIGSSEAEVTAAYGEDREEYGQQVEYENGDCVLSILFEGGKAISVEYTAVNDLLA